MCVLILCKDRALEKEEFDEAWSKNKDGFGYAYHIEDGKISFKKGMMEREDAYKEYCKINNNLTNSSTSAHSFVFRFVNNGTG